MLANFRLFFFILLLKKSFLKEFEADILFGGDISFDSPIRLESGSACPYSDVLKHVSKYFKSADYSMINLEAPFVLKQNKNSTSFPNKGIHNMAWPESVKGLTSAGIKSKPLIKEINGIKVGFLAYCGDYSGECEFYRQGLQTSTALLRKRTVKYDLQKLKGKVDFIVTFLHWGSEYAAIPNESQRNMAHYLSQLGVNIIIGTHPHVLQGHERLNNTLVHYSLGNFVYHGHYTILDTLTGDRNNKKKLHALAKKLSRSSRGPTTNTELLKVKFTKSGIKTAHFLPIRIFETKKGCIQPKAKVDDKWVVVCGAQDDNCYVPKTTHPN